MRGSVAASYSFVALSQPSKPPFYPTSCEASVAIKVCHALQPLDKLTFCTAVRLVLQPWKAAADSRCL